MSIEEMEAEFLAHYDPAAFERPSVAVDVAVLTVDAGSLWAALYRRPEHPGRGRFALPGGFVRMDESLDATARRVLSEKLGLSDVFIEQLYTFGAPTRDPRTRVVSVAYYALVAPERLSRLREAQAILAEIRPDESTDHGASALALIEGDRLPLFLDHGRILGVAVQRLRGKLDYAPIGFQLLPPVFTLRQLQRVHETVRGARVNKDSFRRRMLASRQLEETGAREENVSNRPAKLYRFVHRSAL